MHDNDDESNEKGSAEDTYAHIFSTDADEMVEELTGEEQSEVRVWTLGDHEEGQEQPDINWTHWDRAAAFLEDNMPSLHDTLNLAKKQAEEMEVTGFECPECGLIHDHPDNKHDIRSIFNVRQDFVENMRFCPYCHCGVNELARLVNNYDGISVPVFTDEDDISYRQLTNRFDKIRQAANAAPIPDETQQQLNEALGKLN